MLASDRLIHSCLLAITTSAGRADTAIVGIRILSRGRTATAGALQRPSGAQGLSSAGLVRERAERNVAVAMKLHVDRYRKRCRTDAPGPQRTSARARRRAIRLWKD